MRLLSSENSIRLFRGRPHRRFLLRRPQGLREILDDVVGVLETDRQPNHVLADPRGSERRRIQLLMCRAGGMDDQRLGVADIGEMRDELETVDEALTGGTTALD